MLRLSLGTAPECFSMGAVSSAESDVLCTAAEPSTAQLLARGEYVGWLAEENGNIIAGAGIYLRDLPPDPDCLKVERWGHVANVYTLPAYHSRGIARLLMAVLLQWCADNFVDRVTLAASDQGRPLYESMGFVASNDMELPRAGLLHL